jgi:Electron transfer flavoprotein, beta subunit
VFVAVVSERRAISEGFMHILILIKQVPETDKVKMDPETGTMVRSGLESIVNPLDLYAIEEALILKEQFGAHISVLSMGPPDAERALREALSMGCDEAILLTTGYLQV